MARQVRAEIHQADRELRRFINYQLNECRRLGYPIMATFAREIARGTVGLPPPTEEDPIMEAVGSFYYSLREIDRRLLSERYLAMGTDKERAKRMSQSLGRYYRGLDRLLCECAGFLKGRGF